MKAFITGITGFVGSHLAEYLLDCGDAVLGCSIDGGWLDNSPRNLADCVEVVKWDIAEPIPAELSRRLEEFSPDCLYHLAAISIPADCGGQEPSERATAVNINGTRRVLELAASLARPPRVLFVSSCDVYAEVSPGAEIVDENAPVGPGRAYGKTKLAAEKEVFDAAENRGLDVIVARAFQHSGPRQTPRLMLPEWARQFARGDDPVRVICKDSYLDLSDVRDIVRAYRALADRSQSGALYNVGGGVSRRSGDILEQLQRLAQSKAKIEEISPGIRRHPIADNTKLVRATGWNPTIPLEKTLQDTLDYWRSQESA